MRTSSLTVSWKEEDQVIMVAAIVESTYKDISSDIEIA
jgi:hypothetical protein